VNSDLSPAPVQFARRYGGSEMMDDFSIIGEELTNALEELRLINRWSGGHLASIRQINRVVAWRGAGPVRILDLATGIADYPEAILKWADRRGIEIEIVAVDANEETCRHAVRSLDSNLDAKLRARVTVMTVDALASGFPDRSFDVVHAALFLHHLDQEESVELLREMRRIARQAVVINDLHRHPVAYFALRLVGKLLPVSEMFRHDGPVSVLKGFNRSELTGLARAAGMNPQIAWFPGFRWLMTDLQRDV
jgi:2-polyprenyl-3-methyl-5-hydroxy-6-metoxy-1,4-benzoquinol methylase